MHTPPPVGQSSMLHLRILGPLMLMFLVCDADSTCSEEENPLELNPPEVVAEYSETESVFVNCTSSDEYHDGLNWEIGDKISEELDKNYILQPVPLSDWSLKAKCLVKLSDIECMKELELGITLYKIPDIVSVSAVDPAPMVEGREYSLKCDVMNVAPVKNLKVKWYKGTETVKTVLFTDTGVTPVNESSLLTFTAKRDDNGALYRCSAELHLGPNGPELIPNATSLPYTADVFYEPRVQTCPVYYRGVEHVFSLDMLPCQADGNPPPTVQWYYQADLIHASEPLNRTHSGFYTAEFKNAYGISSTSLNITIEYPPSFACNDHYEVQEDDKFQAVCEAEGIPQPVTTWFKDGEEIATPQRWTKKDSGTYILNATNKHGKAQHKLIVNVLYAPQLKNETEEVFVNEGADVTLTCEAEGNPPPAFNWTRDEGNISKNTSTFNISHMLTSTTYNCTASNYLGSVTKQIHVHVLKSIVMAQPAPMITTVAPAQIGCSLALMPAEAVVRFGDEISVNCSTSSTEVSAIGWEATIGGKRLSKASAITWMVEKVEVWTLTPMCYLNKRGGMQCTEVANIIVYKTPDIVSVSAVDPAPMVEGREYSLKCDVMNVAPVKNLKVKWYKGTETVKTVLFTDTGVTPVNESSLLTFTAKRDDNGALYRCSAELHLGPNGPELIPNATSLPYTADVFYEPRVQTCPDHYRGVEHGFSLDSLPCKADGNPPPTVQWYYQADLIHASEPLNRTHSGIYIVSFKNAYGISSTSLNITIEYPPSFACNDYYEVQEDNKFQSVCEAEGIPQPVTTWFKDGEEIATPQRWTKNDSGNYIINATNKHGIAQHKLIVNVLYAPVFKEKNYSKEVATGENVTLECLAEGNPPPEVRWTYTPAENVNVSTTGGRQKNISVTGATSTNAGAYICVATNKVGRVTRSVTLTLKGKSSGFPTVAIWLLVILVIAIIIFSIIYYNRKKHGQYDFVPDRPIPLNTTGGELA